MARRCTVCTHHARQAIDQALVAGESRNGLADRYGLAERSVRRHADNHLPEKLAKAAEAEQAAEADDLLGRLTEINRETMEVLKSAKGIKNYGMVLQAIARVEKQIELQAKLLGQLQEGATVNILVSPEWMQVQSVILRVLAPYPEVRVAVATALAEVGGAARN